MGDAVYRWWGDDGARRFVVTFPVSVSFCCLQQGVVGVERRVPRMGTTHRPSPLSPACPRRAVRVGPSPSLGRSASAPFVRPASPFVRLEKTIQLGRLSEQQPLKDAVATDPALPPEIEDTGSEREVSSAHSCRASALSAMSSFASPRSTEYCCAICIDLLLRPVVLSCGHRLCRGCWVRVLQGSQARAVASRTGNAVCPLGRCEVRPCVPEVDRDLESEMRSRLGFKQLAAHAAATELTPFDEENASAAAVNAWAAAGCTLDRPEEVMAQNEAIRRQDEAEEAAAVAAEMRALDEELRALETAAAMAQWLRWFCAATAVLLILLSLFAAGVLDGEAVLGFCACAALVCCLCCRCSAGSYGSLRQLLCCGGFSSSNVSPV